MDFKEILARVTPFDEVIVSHPMLMKAYQGVSRCVAMTEAFQEPMGSLLLARSGLGKTTICKMLLKSMAPSVVEEDACTRQIIPAFYAEVPAKGGVNHLASNLLKQLNDPSPFAGEVPDKTDRIVALLKNCETKLVLLDEFHHLVKIGIRSTQVKSDVCDWVKSLVNNSDVSFCLIGLPRIASILPMEEELARRFPRRFELRQFYPGSKNDPGELEVFLNSMARSSIQKVGLKGFPCGEEALFANQVYAATQGIPDFIKKLMREAIVVALAAGSEWVDREDFALAWDDGICVNSSLVRENPFRLDEATLRRLVKGGIQ